MVNIPTLALKTGLALAPSENLPPVAALEPKEIRITSEQVSEVLAPDSIEYYDGEGNQSRDIKDEDLGPEYDNEIRVGSSINTHFLEPMSQTITEGGWFVGNDFSAKFFNRKSYSYKGFAQINESEKFGTSLLVGGEYDMAIKPSRTLNIGAAYSRGGLYGDAFNLQLGVHFLNTNENILYGGEAGMIVTSQDRTPYFCLNALIGDETVNTRGKIDMTLIRNGESFSPNNLDVAVNGLLEKQIGNTVYLVRLNTLIDLEGTDLENALQIGGGIGAYVPIFPNRY